MRLHLTGAVLLSAAAYYVYLPLPPGVSEPWKLMLLDALFRSFMTAVRRTFTGYCVGEEPWDRDRRDEKTQCSFLQKTLTN